VAAVIEPGFMIGSKSSAISDMVGLAGVVRFPEEGEAF
jgi:hypothetical protein